ncbi:MAG: hypothetical protein KW802_02020 [Candidatus Doudnabacteria bacterium]|nr:hypothetical protein [Candidatus Doudnabacteria bacterium]
MSKRTVITIIVLLLVLAGIIWLSTRKDDVKPTPVLSVSAFDKTQNKSATDITVHPEDEIVYTLTAENQSDETISGYVMEANISEITDKASLLDASGASYNAGTNSLVWTPLDIPANQSISKGFSVRVNPVPAGSTSTVMKIKFNNELAINVAAPQVAATNTNTSASYKAPKSGPSGFVAVAFAALATVVFAYRKKLLGITA